MTRYISLLLMIGCVCLGTVLLAAMMLRLVYEISGELLVELQKRLSRRARKSAKLKAALLKRALVAQIQANA